MEGLTGYLWRQVHAALFGPADKYFTPFLSPNATRTFQRKELDEIDPAQQRRAVRGAPAADQPGGALPVGRR
ncbi:MAG: hypothetical protein ACLR5H_07300 [Oscillospiraceae bacterium]